jgi:hypothetical protein
VTVRAPDGSAFKIALWMLELSRCGAEGVPVFVQAGAPSDDELHALLHAVIARLMKMLTRRGVLVEEMGQIYLPDPNADGDEARTLPLGGG